MNMFMLVRVSRAYPRNASQENTISQEVNLIRSGQIEVPKASLRLEKEVSAGKGPMHYPEAWLWLVFFWLSSGELKEVDKVLPFHVQQRSQTRIFTPPI